MRWAALFLGMRLLAGAASLSSHEFGVPSSSRGKGTVSRPSPNIQMLQLRGGGVPMEEGGTRDNREYFAAGKTIRNSQHIVDEWIEHNFPLQNRKEWGHACLGLGACCIVLSLAPLPLLNCFLSRKMLLAANILITGGAFLVSGPTSIRRFLFAPRRRLGTVILFAGFTMVWRRWTILGLLVEFLGFLGLFGPFLEGFPLVCPSMPTSSAGFVKQLRKLYSTITAPMKHVMGSLDLEQREW